MPSWINRVSLEPFSLNIIVGPRQVGKTTGVKLLIRDLVEKTRPESVFYFNCELLPDMESLRRLVDYYMSIADSKGVRRRYLFLDEVTSVNGWWRVVKGYVDLGLFRSSVVTVTGSSSLRLKGEAELFPGRRGKGRDVIVMPLSFREYAGVNGFKAGLSGSLSKDMSLLSLHKRELAALFEEYLRKGGYPLSINEDPRAGEYMLLSLEGEVLRLQRSWPLVRSLVASLLRKAPSPVSYSALGHDTGVSYKTVEEYLELLKRLFVIDLAYYKEGERIVWRKEKKIFFLDPFSARTLSSWCGVKPLESAVLEWVVQSHMSRRFGGVYYYRNRYEIDCIAGGLRVEVKAGKPHRRYPRGVVELDHDDIPLFLYAIAD